MAQVEWGSRDSRGDWHPGLIEPVPLFHWPFRLAAFSKWLFGYPGYLWPWNILYVAISVLTWTYLTPDLAGMKSFAPGWIALVFARNLVILVAVISAWHLRLYVQRSQDQDYKYNNRWLSKKNATFLFGDQVLDNMFWTVASAVPIWTAYEVATLWAFANGYIPSVDWRVHPVYCTVLLLVIPIYRDLHFYLIHRLIHWRPLYRMVHSLHHKNVNPGPWSGLAMHPVEHLLYYSGVLIHWIVPSHPLHVVFHLQHLSFAPAQGHSGFERVVIKGDVSIKTHDYYHYLHHRYFECNYGGDGTIPFDRLFGTLHDGSEATQKAMHQRVLARHRRKSLDDTAS